MYVADRLVLQTLSQADIAAISSGEHQMDAFVRRYIHQNLRYRFQMVPDGATGYRIEAAIKNGDWDMVAPCSTPHGYDSSCAAASSSSPQRDGLSTGLRRPLARVGSVGGLMASDDRSWRHPQPCNPNERIPDQGVLKQGRDSGRCSRQHDADVAEPRRRCRVEDAK